jgi:phospholipid/cholesterol/gamma-HCH transport system ATP-binding protein
MIKISNLSKAFENQVVLDDVSFEIKSGEIIAILGESGTGKSVLLKHMMGLLKPDQGTIEIDGVDITGLKEHQMLKVRQKIGYLFQEGALYDFLNVFDNIAFPLREHTKLNRKQIEEKIQETLELVDLKGTEKKFPPELSGGMKKRVGLARAIILGSKMLFCDEPTSGLDPIRSRDISDLIKDISRRLNCLTVITSHDIKNSFRMCDRVVLLKDGKIVGMGSPEDLQSSNDNFVKEFIS